MSDETPLFRSGQSRVLPVSPYSVVVQESQGVRPPAVSRVLGGRCPNDGTLGGDFDHPLFTST